MVMRSLSRATPWTPRYRTCKHTFSVFLFPLSLGLYLLYLHCISKPGVIVSPLYLETPDNTRARPQHPSTLDQPCNQGWVFIFQ